jgi:hypothetical protein
LCGSVYKKKDIVVRGERTRKRGDLVRMCLL